MRLQGQVYGKFMHQAEIMPGFVEFMLKCRLRGHKILIVSHKTEFGHFDVEQTSLREEALKWMESKRFFDPDFFGMEREDVFFADTREEKVARIAELECDCFIDDLPEVFAEKTFQNFRDKFFLVRRQYQHTGATNRRPHQFHFKTVTCRNGLPRPAGGPELQEQKPKPIQGSGVLNPTEQNSRPQSRRCRISASS